MRRTTFFSPSTLNKRNSFDCPCELLLITQIACKLSILHVRFLFMCFFPNYSSPHIAILRNFVCLNAFSKGNFSTQTIIKLQESSVCAHATNMLCCVMSTGENKSLRVGSQKSKRELNFPINSHRKKRSHTHGMKSNNVKM